MLADALAPLATARSTAPSHADVLCAHCGLPVLGVEPGPDETLKLRADLTVKGNTAPMPMRARVAVRDDGAVRLTTQTTVNRKKWGVTGNMLGMVGDKTTLSTTLVFRRAAG